MSKSSLGDQYRRQFLGKLGIGIAATALAPGLHLISVAQAKPDAEAVDDSVRWGLMIDTTKCSNGCTACVDGCNSENGLEGFDRPATDAQWIRKVELKEKLTGKESSLPMMCQHCEHPPCVDVCPTGASFKREDGVVLVNKHTCIGCRYCMMACPYKARSFVHEDLHNQRAWAPRGKGTVEACTFCTHRIDRDGQPACVEACDKAGHGALVFGNLNDPESEISRRARSVSSRQLRADLNLNTAVRYEGF